MILQFPCENMKFKHSSCFSLFQWFSMIRDHALHVINDHTVFNTIIQRSTKFVRFIFILSVLFPLLSDDAFPFLPFRF